MYNALEDDKCERFKEVNHGKLYGTKVDGLRMSTTNVTYLNALMSKLSRELGNSSLSFARVIISSPLANATPPPDPPDFLDC
jgi:hypothetical protein